MSKQEFAGKSITTTFVDNKKKPAFLRIALKRPSGKWNQTILKTHHPGIIGCFEQVHPLINQQIEKNSTETSACKKKSGHAH